MPDRPDELDLLGLIEGDLPADRRAAVLAALQHDTALRARVDAMRADRSALRDLPPVRAPQGMVSMAVEAAEREELLGVDAGEPVVAGRIGLPRWTRGLAAAAALFLVAGGGLMIWSSLGPTYQQNPVGGDLAVAEESIAVEPQIAGLEGAAEPAGRADEQGAGTLATASLAGGNALPLEETIRAIDRHEIDWSQGGGRGHLTLVIAQSDEEPHPATLAPIPQVTAASFDDAMRLASVGRLTLRVRASDAAATRTALQEFGGRGANEVLLVSEEPRGAARYEVEMSRADCAFAELLGALCAGPGSDAQAFFDVALMPSQADRSFDAFAAPRQITSGEPRVGMQVLIEPAVY